jgi:predicted nucleotidyltransferase
MVKKVNTKDAIVQRILKARERLALLGVRSIGLFGSFVRGEQTSSWNSCLKSTLSTISWRLHSSLKNY